MIWHELSQSAANLNWNEYPYMYVHVGLTADFLASVADYHRASGDTAFVAKHWEALQLAYRYCRKLLDASGLPEIPSDKQGANEQDALGDELSLSAGWVAASEAFADLANATGHPGVAREARGAAARARQAIGTRYWDDERHYWISGHTRSGAPVRDRESRPAGTVLQGLFSAQQRAAALDQLAAADFQTDTHSAFFRWCIHPAFGPGAASGRPQPWTEVHRHEVAGSGTHFGAGSGAPASFELRTPWKIESTSGAELTPDGRFTVKRPPGRAEVTVKFGS